MSGIEWRLVVKGPRRKQRLPRQPVPKPTIKHTDRRARLKRRAERIDKEREQ